MSRVFFDQKFVNMPRHSGYEVGSFRVVRIHSPNEDYHNAPTLSAWLFMKYDMKYTTFRRKSVAKKQQLRLEYEADTGNSVERKYDYLEGYVNGCEEDEFRQL